MQEWQKNIWAAISGSGVKASEMQIVMSGRRMGKSALAQYWNIMYNEEPKYTEITKAPVDGTMWYTVKCSKEVCNWIRQEYADHEQWYEHVDQNWNVYFSMFDMHEEFYMMLKLRWGT